MEICYTVCIIAVETVKKSGSKKKEKKMFYYDPEYKYRPEFNGDKYCLSIERQLVDICFDYHKCKLVISAAEEMLGIFTEEDRNSFKEKMEKIFIKTPITEVESFLYYAYNDKKRFEEKISDFAREIYFKTFVIACNSRDKEITSLESYYSKSNFIRRIKEKIAKCDE